MLSEYFLTMSENELQTQATYLQVRTHQSGLLKVSKM